MRIIIKKGSIISLNNILVMDSIKMRLICDL
jgi:hypothetical protein